MEINTIICGKSEKKLKDIPDNFFDGIVTDPPYGINFMGKEWDNFEVPGGIASINGSIDPTAGATGKAHSHGHNPKFSKNFQNWFYIIAVEMLRVSKPGSHLLCFGGTRTHHRVACAIEDAGWILRDEIDWIYGEGFPKSCNISKQLDKEAGVEREFIGDNPNCRPNCEGNKSLSMSAPITVQPLTAPATSDAKRWDGYGTALKPAHEPIIVAMKPLEKGLTFAQNAKKWNVAGLNIDGCRIGTEQRKNPEAGFIRRGRTGEEVFNSVDKNKPNNPPHEVQGRWPSNIILSHSPDCVCVGTKIINEGASEGGYTYSDKEYQVEGFVKDCKPQAPSNRGQETVEVYACVPDCPIRIMDEQSGDRSSTRLNNPNNGKKGGLMFGGSLQKIKERSIEHRDSGGASRFFYCAKAKRSERENNLKDFVDCVKCGKFNSKTHTIGGDKRRENCIRNNHPTVKPVSLMKYLLTLIKMPSSKESKQIILDPFCGSGSTLVAAEQLGINYIGIDQDLDNVLISTARIG